MPKQLHDSRLCRSSSFK